MPTKRIRGQFIAPMLLLAVRNLPEGDAWVYELKLDGYRAIAIKTNGRVQLRSRNNKDFGRRYPTVAAALSDPPDETVIDGEIVALDESGRPSFNALQNYGTSKVPIFYYVFDVPVLSGHHLRSEPLAKRRDLLRRHVLPKVKDPIRQCPELNASLSEVIRAVQAQVLEGVVAKDLKSAYESGRRSGVWCKMRLNKGQEFVIGGYTPWRQTFRCPVTTKKVSSSMRAEPATGLPQCRGNNCCSNCAKL